MSCVTNGRQLAGCWVSPGPASCTARSSTTSEQGWSWSQVNFIGLAVSELVQAAGPVPTRMVNVSPAGRPASGLT